MPDASKPQGVDMYVREGFQDYQMWADKGVQFAFLKYVQGDWVYDSPASPDNPNAFWFSKSWQDVKNAGLLRSPYLFPMAAHLTVANAASVTAANWQHWPIDDVDPEPGVNHTDGEKSIDYILQQTNNFCDLVLAQGWGRPGDLPPAVDIESTNFFTTAGQPVPFFAQNDDRPEIWQRLAQADRINAIVVLVVQIENRLGVKPFIYCGGGWWEHIDAVDNGGAGFVVNHRGIQYRVNHFGDYPLWCLAHTTATANQIIIPRAWAFRPAPAESRFIWQFQTAPFDLNAVVQMSASAANPAIAGTVIATVSDVTEMSWLEGLAKINPPAPPVTLTRVSPPPLSPIPQQSFNILVVGQHFRTDEWQAVVQRLWTDPAHLTSITDTPPFAALQRSSRVAGYADDGTGVFLKIRQTPSGAAGFDDVLAIPPEAASRLQTYLNSLQIQSADGSLTPAVKVWPAQRRLTGSTGTLVVVLRNNPGLAALQAGQVAAQVPAELYQLDPSENYPIPLVAVNIDANDDLWPQVVVRALAQNLGGLADEYERPGDAFDHPDDNLAVPVPPNLIRIDQATRATLPALAAGAPVPADLANAAIGQWHLALNAQLDFYSNGAQPGAAFGATHLVEGGDGFRHNVLRSDFDCLMRRIPSGVAKTFTPVPPAAPIRAQVPFCRVCTEWLQAVLQGGQDFRPGAVVRLDTQRICFDWVAWASLTQPAAFAPNTAFNQTITLAVPTTEPQWSMTVNYAPNGATVGDLFQITAVKLAQRPNDPYAKAVDILKTLKFTDLKVTYVPATHGASVTKTLTVADAIANTRDKPRLDIGANGGNAREYQAGAKLTLAFPITSAGNMLFTVEVVLGLVLSGAGPIDPRGPTVGCRLLPQFAMSVRRAARLLDGGGSVTSLAGSAFIDAINAIAPDPGLDASIASIATGKLAASLVCESNTAGQDSIMAAPSAANVVTPTSGRKLAAVDVVVQPFVMPIRIPPLHWSWRYDHLRTFLAASQKVTGAYSSDEAKGKPTPARTLSVNWPSISIFNMDETKLPKQGQYDAVIVQPVDTSATPVASFPASGDLTLALPMRYGLAGGDGFGNALGWGTGRLDQGSQTTNGAPLVPPNQHVDLTVNPVAAGEVTITYAVTAQAPQPNERQVFLAQGLKLGYGNGIGILQMAWLAWLAALAGIPSAQVDPLWAAAKDVLHPATLDRAVRAFFHSTLHPSARNFDNTRDGFTVQQAPEATSVGAGVEAL